MRDRDDRAGELLQMALEPRDRARVEMVRRLVQQQQVRLLHQHHAQRHAPLLAAREDRALGVERRQLERLGGELELALDLPGLRRLDLLLQRVQLVERPLHLVGVELGRELRADLLVTAQQLALVRDRDLELLAHRLLGIELRLLRHVSDRDPGLVVELPFEVLLDAGHDPEQGRFALAVGADDADLRAVVESERDVGDDDLLVIRLLHALHLHDVVSHGAKRPPDRAAAKNGGRGL